MTMKTQQLIAKIDASLSLSQTGGLTEKDRCTILAAALISLKASMSEDAQSRAAVKKARREARESKAAKSNTWKRWDADEEGRAMTLWSEGATLERIASALSRTPGAIAVRLESMRVAERAAIWEANLGRGGEYGRVALEQARPVNNNGAI